MPPSGCYFSRDNKNYRLSGLENNRSSGLPPDRGLHSLSLDTQAVAVDVLFLFLPWSPPFDSHRQHRRCRRHRRGRRAFPSLFPSLSDFHSISFPFRPSSPAVVALTGPGTPYDAPGVPPFAPRCPLATSPWPVAWLAVAARLPRDSLNLQFQVASNATTTTGRPLPLYILHIINYQSLSVSSSLSLSLSRPVPCASLAPHRVPARSVGWFFRAASSSSLPARNRSHSSNVSKGTGSRYLSTRSTCGQVDEQSERFHQFHEEMFAFLPRVPFSYFAVSCPRYSYMVSFVLMSPKRDEHVTNSGNLLRK